MILLPRTVLSKTILSRTFSPYLTPRRNLAGHNKWSKIKRKKAVKDTQRSTAFGKASRAIAAAARNCNGDIANLQLQSAIIYAKSIQLGKDRIQEAIERGSRPREGGDNFISIRYDGMLHTSSGKVAVIITALTDNRNRTAGKVRAILSKAGGELLGTGAHEWIFENVGVALVSKRLVKSEEEGGNENDDLNLEIEEDELLECALDGGATDVDFGDVDDELVLVKCDPSDLQQLVQTLEKSNYKLSEFGVRWMVKEGGHAVSLERGSEMKLESFLDKMDEDDDVTDVFHNAT